MLQTSEGGGSSKSSEVGEKGTALPVMSHCFILGSL